MPRTTLQRGKLLVTASSVADEVSIDIEFTVPTHLPGSTPIVMNEHIATLSIREGRTLFAALSDVADVLHPPVAKSVTKFF